MAEACPRCGTSLGRRPTYLCDQCWEATADESLVEKLAEDASQWPMAAKLLGHIADVAAAPSLRVLLASSEARVRAGALHSLGYSGTRDDVPVIAQALGDDDEKVREAARAALAELGGPAAADALAVTLEEVEERELDQVVQALAWLRDARALTHALGIAEDTMFVGPPFGGHRAWFGGAWSAVRLGGRAWCDATEARVIELASSVDPSVRWRENPAMVAAHLAEQGFLEAVGAEDWDERKRRESRIRERASDPRSQARREYFARQRAQRQVDPLLPRDVPKLAFIDRSDARPQVGAPVAKFAGQPEWREAPAWPLGAGGHPLVFYGQLPLLGKPERTGYIFFEPEGHHFAPLGEANALVVQPGARPQLPTIPAASGPELFRMAPAPPRLRRLWKHERYEVFMQLKPGADPAEWTWPDDPDALRREQHGDWNKVGGTPRYLQGEETPPGEGWRFAFQFGADYTGRELGDGAECYGFIDADGRGAFLWQCH